MATLGFRPPQFSEDLAWLPAWLQNPEIESSSNHLKETLTNSTTQLEAFSSRVEEEFCRINNNFNLFLSSGDYDISQISASPSPRNVLRFCLRLSSDGESLQSASRDLVMSQTLAQRVETSDGSKERLYESNVAENVGLIYQTNEEGIDGKNVKNIDHNDAVPSSLSPRNCEENVDIEERCNVKRIKDVDVNDAIELSIAASEALVMRELMCSGSTSEVVSTEAILEAALHVKQPRFEEALEDGNCCSSNEIDDIDVFPDLDDLVMKNAFLDVGLSINDADDHRGCGSDVSQDKNIPVDSHHRHKNGSKHEQLIVRHDNISNGSALGLDSTNLVSPVLPLLHQLAEAILHVPAVAQPQVDVSPSLAPMSENDGAKKVCSLVADKFQSRWLRGWTVQKEADTSAKLKQNNNKGIPKFFDCETSFLSESADVADENSFVHKHETASKIASQSSIPFEGALDKADEGISFFQEVGSSDPSLVDSLCSVVPCSISSEKAGSLLAEHQDDREANAQNCITTGSEHRMESSQRLSDLNIAPPYGDGEAVPTISGEYCEAPVRRREASLKIYSRLLPKHEAILEGQQLNQNQPLSSEYIGKSISPNGSSDQMNFLPFRPEYQCPVGIDYGTKQELNIIRSPLSDHDEPAKEGSEGQSQRRSPLVLNRRTRCRLRPSELLVRTLAEEKTPEKIPNGTASEADQRKELRKVESKLKNPHSKPNLVRKRVCFSEFEVGLQQKKDIQKAQTWQRDSSAIRANKRSKYSKPWSDFQTQDAKNCLKDHINDMKRLIFHGLQFLLTGFSSRKEREIASLIQECGGMVLLDVPPPPSNSRAKRCARFNFQQLPIIICSKKLQTTKFLYGCAVNALILKVKWLADSVAACSVMPPEKYMIMSNRAGLPYTRSAKLGHCNNTRRIFDRVGIMLHGKHSFCTKLAVIIKHGGGQVFKTLQRLFQSLDNEKISAGAIVAEDESRASRHLRHCASERKLSVMPASWIAKSLHFGKLLPFKEKEDALTVKAPEPANSLDWSVEI